MDILAGSGIQTRRKRPEIIQFLFINTRTFKECCNGGTLAREQVTTGLFLNKNREGLPLEWV